MKNKSSGFKRLMAQKATPLFIILIILMIVAMILSSGVLEGAPLSNLFTEGFFSKVNWLTNFYTIGLQMMMMIGLSAILISGNIDLSIAAQAAFGGLIFAKLLESTTLPWGIVLLITLVLAVIMGLINTGLVTFFRLPAFIATIGMSSVYSGLCNVLTRGNSIQISRQSFLWIGSKSFFGVVPLYFIIALACLIIFQFILTGTVFGRTLYMAGGNRMAARLCGLKPTKQMATLFIINSVLAVSDGILYAAQNKLAHPTAIVSASPNMTAMTAAILGGVAFTGGSGNLIGPLVAVFLINVFSNVLRILSVNEYWIIVAQGVLLIGALLIDFYAAERRKRAQQAAAMAG